MEVITIMLKYFAKQHGISEDAAAELLCISEDGKTDRTKLKPDIAEVLIAKDKERVEGIKKDVDKTAIFNEAYDKATKDVRTKTEKALIKKYGLEDVKATTVEEVVEAIVSKATADNKGGKLDDEAVKKHPLYLSLERTKTEEVKQLEDKFKDDLAKIETEKAREAIFGTVTDKVLTYLDDLKPILPTDGKKAANQRADFAAKFKNYEYQPIEGAKDEFLILDGGRRMEDGHGNPLTLKTLAENVANDYFEFAKQDDKGNAGNKGKAGATVTVPKNEEEFNQAIFNAATPEERAAVEAAYTPAE